MKTIFYILFTIFGIATLQAQKETNIWHFGRNSGLDFNNPTVSMSVDEVWWNGASWSYNYNVNMTNIPKVISGYVNTYEGCFTMSDSDGNLLMSSDGATIYNKNGIALNTTPLGGHSSAIQSGIVIPKPGNSDRHYVVSVTHERQGKLQYAEIDISMNSGVGGIVSQNNQLTTFNADENIAAVPHKNGVDYWLINRTMNNYHVWEVTNAGFTYKGFTYKGFTPTGSVSPISTYDFIGELIISPDGTRLIALTFDRNEILSANFEALTGQITNTNTRKFSSPKTMGFYGGCFSPNGDYFYFTQTQLTADPLYSYCISWAGLRSGANLKMIAPMSNVHRGSDGRLYGIRRQNRMLLIIENSDLGNLHTKYIQNHFSASQLPEAGLPTFLSSYFKTNISMFPLACSQNARELRVEITSGGVAPATTIDWDFGDVNTILKQSVATGTHIYSQIHTYATPGIKIVTITPRTASGVAKPIVTFNINVIPCAIKANRMIRADLKEKNEP